MKSDEALAAEQAVEAKLAEAGMDQIRRHSFDDTPEAAPTDEGTPAETEDAQPRNELGQFATEQTPEETDAATEVVAQDGQDPAVKALLAKYGGDPDKALAAAVHAQRQLGKQSSEVGALRAENEQMAAMVAELQGLRQDITQARPAPMDQATVDWFDQQVMERPEQAMAWAQQSGNPLLVQRGIETWKDVDPYGAAVYTNRLENQQMYAQLQAQQQKQAQLPVDATVNLALQNVRGRNPQFANYDDAIEHTLSAHPFAAQALKAATESGDPAQIEGAIETLYSLAVGDTLQSLALTPPEPGAEATLQDVAVPSVAETRDPPPEPTQMDQFREQFRQEAERHKNGAWVAG